MIERISNAYRTRIALGAARRETPILGNPAWRGKQRFPLCLSRRARCACRQNFTRSPLTNASWRFVDDALPMFEIAAILR
ncbi:hypothetical protein BAR24066_05681 [Burkholderia arboris]|uniref:Uncharacterized protein n=1 Tax=Burkholderia arboris TaxID=488730 RepID=A0A9Q9UTF6_9BURK|nr:hypothetical protein BAR24066_05681 [Burkholderia arboris]